MSNEQRHNGAPFVKCVDPIFQGFLKKQATSKWQISCKLICGAIISFSMDTKKIRVQDTIQHFFSPTTLQSKCVKRFLCGSTSLFFLFFPFFFLNRTSREYLDFCRGLSWDEMVKKRISHDSTSRGLSRSAGEDNFSVGNNTAPKYSVVLVSSRQSKSLK